jgi:hypothetical protein
MPYPKGPSGKLYPNASAGLPVLPPSTIRSNYIHDAHSRGPDAPGAGNHFPGGLYNDEGSTNWLVTGNVVGEVGTWLQGCRPGCNWMGPNSYTGNFFRDIQSPAINVDSRCANTDNADATGKPARPATAAAIAAAAGPRPENF